MQNPNEQRTSTQPYDGDEKPQAFDQFTPFWEAFNAEEESYYSGLMKEWTDNLDTLLVFAGLFASVNTTFIIETYRDLREDSTDASNLILKNILHRLDNSTFTPEELQFTQFRASNTSIRVNCFFFSSLSLSLFAAFGAVLAKQWISRLSHSTDSGTQVLADRARRRHVGLKGIESWLEPIIETLPTLLQIALFLFLIGLLDFLWHIQTRVAYTVLAISLIIAIFYFITTLTSVLYPNSPFQTRFSMSLRLLLKRTDRPSMGQGDIGFEDELHYKCVVWLYGRTTLPSTVRTLCKAITMLPDTVHGSVNLRDWSVVARYVRSFINGGVISPNIQNSTLPSILEVLSQLVQKSTSPPTEQDLRLVCSELISILPENLYNSSGKQILGILGNANRTPVAFRQMVIDLHGAIGDLSDGQPNSNHSPIIDHFLLLLGRAWEGREFDLIIQIVDLLDKSVRSGLQALELDEEEKIHIFLALLEDDQFDRTITSSVRESLLSVSSLLIRGVIQHRVEGMNSTRSSRSTAGLHRTLSTLEKLLADHGMDKDDWEVNLLTLFPWLVGRDIDACAHIIKLLAILVPTPPSPSLDLKDFKSFLEATSPMKPSIDWLPASMVVLLWISRWDASAAWSCLKAWVIPELPLEDYFLAKVRKRERHTERLTRLQFTGKWLRLQPIDIHKTMQVLEELVECASNDVYLKVMKDLLSCVTDLWYDRLVEEGHLRIMCRIMRGVEDERSCHWIACFFFIAIWRWKWTEATKIGKRADFGPFLDEEVVSSVIHFLTSSRNEITRWNFEHFGLNFDDVITVEEAISCCSTYLQIAATTGSISKKMIPSLLDGYKGWVMSILELSSELGKKVDSSLWRDAHDTAGTLFIPLNKTLTHLEGCPQATAVEPSLDSQQHLIDTSVPLVIRSSRSDLILEYPRSSDDNTMGRPVKSQQYQGTENQQWMFIPATPGAYLIQNMGTGGYLTYSKKLPQAPRRFSDGTQFVTERGIAPTLGVEVLCDIIPSEWMVVPNGQKNEMKLLLRDFPTFALDLKGFSKQSGTTYILWTDHKDPRKWNQSFQLERVNT